MTKFYFIFLRIRFDDQRPLCLSRLEIEPRERSVHMKIPDCPKDIFFPFNDDFISSYLFWKVLEVKPVLFFASNHMQ